MQKFGITITWVFGIIASLPFLLLGFLIAQDNLARFVHSQDCRNKSKVDLTDKTWQQENIQFTTKNLKIKEVYALHTTMGGMPLFFGFNSSYSCEIRLAFDFQAEILTKNGELIEPLDIFPYFDQNKPRIAFKKEINLEENNKKIYDLQQTLESNKNYNSILKWKSNEFVDYILVFAKNAREGQGKFWSTDNFDFSDKIHIYNKVNKKWSILELSKPENKQILENYLDQKIGQEKQKTIVQIGFGQAQTLVFMVLENEQTLNKKVGDEVEVSGIAIGFAEKDGKIILLPE